MDVGSVVVCERHELPLDERGECQLCRLSDMPSTQPPSGARRWFMAALIALVLGAGALAFTAFSGVEQAAPERGVPTRGAGPSSVTPVPVPMPPQAKPIPSIPEPPTPPTPEQVQDRRVEVAPPPPTPAPAERPQRTITEEDAKAALSQVKIEMYSAQWCGSCRSAREYLNYNEIAYTEYDIDQDEAAKGRLTNINPGTSIPTFQIDDIVQVGFSPENFEFRLDEAVRQRLD